MKFVLVVEDDPDDWFLMKMACKRTGIPHQLHCLTDGEAVIDYLSGKGPYANRATYPLPDLLFLDIKMPKVTGHEALEWIRSQAQFKTLPVVMLTGSEELKDIKRAYRLGVTSYLRKMNCPAEFGQAVRVILKYWLELNIPAR